MPDLAYAEDSKDKSVLNMRNSPLIYKTGIYLGYSFSKLEHDE